MFYWKYCDIPEEDIKFIQNLYKENMPSNPDFFQEIAIPIKTFMNLKISIAVLIQASPLLKGTIHTDYQPKEDSPKLALNIPLENCEDSITNMWSSKNKITQLYFTPNKSPHHYYDPEACTKITEFRLTKPVLFNTTVPHSVDNMSDKWRRAISLRFESDPWHLVND
jgi:hypothetical protein